MTDIHASATKQEQRPATEAVTEVAPGVIRTQLPINFTGLGHVNMYCLVDRKGVAVVDPGMPGRRAWQSVVAALRRAGVRIRDVHTVVITHSHPDHFGGAARLASEANAAVVAHAEFRVPWLSPAPDLATLDDDPPDGIALEASRGPEGLSVPWRAPGDVMRPPRIPTKLPAPVLKVAWRMGRRMFQVPSPTVPLKAGATVRLADRDWVAVHTPGHTADHLCLHDPEQRVLLAGDHVLPTITPHVSGIGCGVDPLRSYLDALTDVARLDVDTVLPAHGDPFDNLRERTVAIAHHHDQRLDRLREIARSEGPSSIEVFTHALFPERQWGLMAESEVFAHLEHLRRAGGARAWRDNGVLIYDLADAPD